MREDVEVYPGDPKLKKKVFCTFEKNNCQYNIYTLGDHLFHPHGDAPGHLNQEYKDRGFDFWDLNYAFNKAILVDLTQSKMAKKIDGIKIHTTITEDDIKPHLDIIKKSQAVVFRTGYDKWLEANKKHLPKNIPHFDQETATILANIKKLRVIGVDSLTVDPVGSNYAHRKFKDKLIVESLVRLYNIPRKYRNDFTLQTSPVAIIGATGGPVVAYAYLQI